ncbi:MAG: DUF1329 domain-containing protein [Candidatus Binatia bacterium]
MKTFLGLIFVGVMGFAGGSTHAEVSESTLQKLFYPYEKDWHSEDLPVPGTMISRETWQPAQQYLPREILERVKAGELSFAIQPTTNLPVSEPYIAATRRHAGQARLDAEGHLEGYVSGLPFPRLDPADSQSGLKAAWNLRHRDFGDVMQVWNTFRLLPESGSPDREIENYYVVAYGMHRPRTEKVNPNQWETDGVLFKEFFHILAPFDLKNSMSLKVRYTQERYKDDNWVYSPASRKIRKVIVTMDEAAYDSGFLNEDYFGYWGYVRSCHWKFLGEQRLLAPIGVKAARVTFGGRGNWYPIDPWELREVIMLECVPRAHRHLYSKRVLYIDKQTFTPVYVLFYDEKGRHQKTLFEVYGDPKYNPGNEEVRFPVWVGESMIDYHDAFATITEVTKISYTEPLPADFFNLDRILARGQ